MAGRIVEKSSEKDLYVRKQINLHMQDKSESVSRKIILKKSGDALAKKRGIMKQEKDSCEMDEEATLVGIAVKSMMDEVKSGKRKTYKLEDVLKEENRRRGLR
jgi:hypothetical protein